ncbi:hypothetical protein OAG56_00530 [Mariniblastus sp.]|nr:hypothetical protein [Mariniblastus sp.]MDB4755826.1 hypothetical protein [Mariniblastus sp.]
MAAGPLHWFRKNQKIMLVVFGVLLIFVFTVGGILDGLFNNQGQQVESVREVATTSFASFTNRDMDTFAEANRYAADFTFALYQQAGFSADGQTSKAKAVYIQPINTNANTEIRDREILYRLSLAEYAKEKGMYVGEDILNEYFSKLCNNELGNQSKTVESFSRELEQRYSLDSIKNHLKTELLALYGSRLINAGFASDRATPTEIFEGLKRLQEKVQVEYLEIPVSDFKSEASDDQLSDDERKKLYQEGFDREPNFAVGPGFKTPRRATIGYFAAKRQDFLDREKKKITDEAIQAKYEEWVNDEKSEVIESPEPSQPADGGSFQPKPEDSEDNGLEEDGQLETQQPGLNSPENASEPTLPLDPATPEKATPEKATPEKENANPPAAKTESNSGSDPCSVDSLQDQPKAADDQAVKKKPVEPKPAEKAAVVPQKETPQENGTTKKGDDTLPQLGTDALPSLKPQDPANDPAPSDAPNPQPPITLQDEASKPQDKPKIKPLDDELRDVIRTELAQEMTDEALKNAIDDVEAKLADYLNDYDYYKSNPEDSDEPKKPNFEKIALSYGLGFKEFVEVDFKTLEDSDFGRTPMQPQQPGNPETPPITALAVFFRDFDSGSNQALHRTSVSSDGIQYIYWVIDRKQATKVDLEKAGPAIDEYYAQVQALKLAEDYAGSVAAEVVEGKQLLSAAYPEKTMKSAEFGWMETESFLEDLVRQNPQFEQQFASQLAPRMGSIKPEGEDTTALEGVTHQFMDTIFKLNENEAGVAVNFDKDKVYVVQVVKKTIQGESQKSKIFDNFKFKQANQVSQLNARKALVDARQGSFLTDKYSVRWFGEPENR